MNLGAQAKTYSGGISHKEWKFYPEAIVRGGCQINLTRSVSKPGGGGVKVDNPYSKECQHLLR